MAQARFSFSDPVAMIAVGHFSCRVFIFSAINIKSHRMSVTKSRKSLRSRHDIMYDVKIEKMFNAALYRLNVWPFYAIP